MSLPSLHQHSWTCWNGPWSWSALTVGSIGEIRTPPSLSANRIRDSVLTCPEAVSPVGHRRIARSLSCGMKWMVRIINTVRGKKNDGRMPGVHRSFCYCKYKVYINQDNISNLHRPPFLFLNDRSHQHVRRNVDDGNVHFNTLYFTICSLFLLLTLNP